MNKKYIDPCLKALLEKAAKVPDERLICPNQNEVKKRRRATFHDS